MLNLLLISAALVYKLVSPAEVDTAMNVIRRQSHQLVSVASTHEDVPNRAICSQLCLSMTAGGSTCRAFSYDRGNKVCKISTEPSAMMTNDVDSASSTIFDIIGITQQSTDCREQFAQPVDNVTFHECATLYSSHPNADGEMSYNAHQKSCLPVLPQLPGSLSCTSGQETWLRYTDFNTTQIYGVPTQISLSGPFKSTPSYPCYNCAGVSRVFDGDYYTHYLNSYYNKMNPYVSGDIGMEYTVAGAVFVARECCSGNHNLHFLVALVEDDLSVYDESICSVWPGPPNYPAMAGNEKAWFPCPLKRARYVKLMTISSNAHLNVAELELYGY